MNTGNIIPKIVKKLGAKKSQDTLNLYINNIQI